MGITKNTKQFVNIAINDFLNSDSYKMAVKAKRYYKNLNDILDKKRYYVIDGQKQKDTTATNNIIAHPIFRDLVDQKLNYLLGNDWNVDNDQLNEIFDDDFRKNIQIATADAIMCGIGWVFFAPDGKVKYMDSTRIVPIWEEDTHENLLGIIYLFNKYEYTDDGRKLVEHAEYWHLEGVEVYKKDGDEYKPIERKNHFDNRTNWLKIPFIHIKYNDDELSLLSLVKNMIDKMDLTASETQDLLSDLSSKMLVISGAEATNPRELAKNKKLYKILVLPEGATCSEIGTEPDVSASTTWLAHLRSQVYIAGRGYDPLQAIGANASGEARRNLYTSLDLDVNQLEIGVLSCFKNLIWFINASPLLRYNIPEDTKIKFTRNMLVNQSEQITNALKSQSIDGISRETIVAMTGLVEDVKQEIKKADEEKEAKQEEEAKVYAFNQKKEPKEEQKDESKKLPKK